MGNGCTKQVENVYFRSRKEAAKQDARLCSREGAAELLGVSPSTVADYELGNTKVVPVDKVDQMAELYNCPELRTLYCRTECPIGKRLPIATQVGCLESVALRFLKEFDNHRMRMMSRAEMMERLAREYGVRNEEELDAAISAMEGVDLGIFTAPYKDATRITMNEVVA